MIYAVMIALEAGVLTKESFAQGLVTEKVRQSVIGMIEEALLTCSDLGGPHTQAPNFKRIDVTVERIGEDPKHIDKVIIKADGVFAKINVPVEKGPEDWRFQDLKVVVQKD